MLLAGALSHMPDHAATAAPSAHANVRAEVTAALDHQPLVRVIVSLTEPQALRSSGPLDRIALKTEIRDKQQRALAGLDASDLQLTYRYEGVSAVVGCVALEIDVSRARVVPGPEPLGMRTEATGLEVELPMEQVAGAEADRLVQLGPRSPGERACRHGPRVLRQTPRRAAGEDGSKLAVMNGINIIGS